MQQIIAIRDRDLLHPELDDDSEQAVADSIAYASLERQRPKVDPTSESRYILLACLRTGQRPYGMRECLGLGEWYRIVYERRFQYAVFAESILQRAAAGQCRPV